MRVRHRIPSIFNLSMVDVLCCALGCVILLWLLNLREAKYHQDTAEEEHKQTTAELEAARHDRDTATSEVRSLRAEREDLRRRIGELQGSVADRDRQLREAAARAGRLEGDLAAAGKRQTETEARLAEEQDKRRLADARMRDLQAAADRLQAMQTELQAARRRYTEEESLARGLEEQVRRRMEEVAELRRRLEASQQAQTSLQQDLARRDRAGADRLAALEKDKKDLQTEIMRVRAAASARFAGIELSGRRVVFLVDMSESMIWIDEKNQMPKKWDEVSATVAQVMRSLPDLKQFQVIAFSDKVVYLLGGEDGWLDFDPASSPRQIQEKLKAIKPIGGTDLYAALAAAFRLRDKGLDTIYLFSDGLPNLGEGLPPDGKSLPEAEKNTILGRHIRQMLQKTWNPEPPGRKVRINAVGFFYESPEVGAFLWALARENDGSFVGMSKP